MKRIVVAFAVVAIAAACFGSGELPARQVTPPVVQQTSWLGKVWDATTTYVRNRANDVGDVGSQTIDAASGYVFADTAKDDQGSFLRDRGCDIGDVIVESGDAVLGIVGVVVLNDDKR